MSVKNIKDPGEQSVLDLLTLGLPVPGMSAMALPELPGMAQVGALAALPGFLNP